MNAGCGRFSLNVVSKSPSVTTSSRLRYQALRGLRRNFCSAFPWSRSQVHLTSFAVNGLPSCHVTPWRNLKVSSLPSSLHDHEVARSGTIDLRLVWAMLWSYITRLLKTPIIGPWPAIVASSWIDMLAGLSKKYILSTPPGFWAKTGLVTAIVAKIPQITFDKHTIRMCVPPLL